LVPQRSLTTRPMTTPVPDCAAAGVCALVSEREHAPSKAAMERPVASQHDLSVPTLQFPRVSRSKTCACRKAELRRLSCMKPLSAALLTALVLLSPPLQAAPSHEIYVTNERSGDLTIVDGDTLKVETTVPLGKRPRGIEASADGAYLFVALSGSPIQGPPE